MIVADVGSDHCRVVPPGNTPDGLARFEFFRHLYAYAEVGRRLMVTDRVLEVGSGEGYGANHLSSTLPFVIGTDMSSQALKHAQNYYPQVNFCQTLGTSLPFASNYFDALVSFQVIEHIEEASSYVQELYRVLKPGGCLFLTTPNRKLRLLPFQKPWSPYHVHEYSGSELRRFLKRWFTSLQIYGVMAQPALMELEKKRVKQSLGRIGLRKIKYWLTKIVTILVGQRTSLIASTRASHKSKWDQVTVELNDFFLSPDVDHSLDLFVIATKTEQELKQ